MRRLLVRLGVAVVLVVPVAYLWWAFSQPSELEGIAPDPEPVVVEAGVAETDGRQEVEVVPVWSEIEWLSAPAWSGTVTDSVVAAGDTLGSGDLVLAIDGVSRMAYHTDQPFYRPILRGSEGPDVAALHVMLADLGFLDDGVGGETASASTVAGVRQLAELLSVPGKVSAFDPGWIIWLPAPAFEVGSLLFRTGDMAPPQGQPMVESLPVLESVTFIEPLIPPDLVAEDWVLELAGLVVEVDVSANAVEADVLARLAVPLAGSAESVAAVLRLAEPVPRVVVPVPAISLYADGATCVWIADGGGYEATPVEVGAARGDTVEVVSGLSAGVAVLSNPAEVLESAVCGDSRPGA